MPLVQLLRHAGHQVVAMHRTPEGHVRLAGARAVPSPVIELTSRAHMALGTGAPIVGTFQGVWPGVAAQEEGHSKSGPTGSTWINTNTGCIRAVRAWGNAQLWIANRPPEHTVVTSQRGPTLV